MTCSDDSSFVDMFNGLRKHVPVQFSTVDVSCTRIYHALNLMWEVGDNIEMSELLLDDMPQFTTGKRESLTDMEYALMHTYPNHDTVCGDMEYALMHTYPNHDTVCGNIEKSRRTEPGRNARPPISPVKKLSTQTSFNIYNKMKAYRTPAGVYDRTTSHSLIH